MIASLTVGGSDRYHGGILPGPTSWLSVNGRPGWVLGLSGAAVPGEPQDDRAREPGSVWVPEAPETIVEDGFLQLAVHVLQDKSLIRYLRTELPELLEPGLVDLTKMNPTTVDDARDLIRTRQSDEVFVLALLSEAGYLHDQLHLLRDYGVQLQVLTSMYSKTWGSFGGPGEPAVTGSLESSRRRALRLVAERLGARWTVEGVESALDALANEHAVRLDADQEQPETVAAVIRAAGLRP